MTGFHNFKTLKAKTIRDIQKNDIFEVIYSIAVEINVFLLTIVILLLIFTIILRLQLIFAI